MPQLKLLEDLLALAQTGSFVRAAELRHVTHPAFGRRIRSLEAWAGTALVDRSSTPVILTPQGKMLLNTAGQVIDQLERVRQAMRQGEEESQKRVRIATGRSLARTLVADWLAKLSKGRSPVLDGSAQIEIATGALADMAKLLEQGKTDLLCCYEHPSLSHLLRPSLFEYMTLATDKLVPVCQTDFHGKPRYPLESDDGKSIPLISYSGGLSMARILGDRLQAFPYPLVPVVHCDSLDAALGTTRNGMGVAWLPWSMVVGDCRRGTLAALGGRSEQISFEVRLYRAKTSTANLAGAIWNATQSMR
ncbi:LysR family transcriptional regulator [Paracandidimonas soli]|uniref:DNA-binding transcriptional LysR family regulator n=1 Tax=Paracandidimonas soli TaxID=1917182 RepID=A0A4R3UQP8_9BURK|nr:LysR substrate-binding domain-containing protein [Paracandidimonas soli]TCU92987.1 DNA-binding transcriptional LysR family regulator [Paracandidimonas soli]